jgi:hypothetical protein
MNLIYLPQRSDHLRAVLNTLKKLWVSQMSATSSRGGLPHQATLCFMKVVLTVCLSAPASVSKWMNSRLRSHSGLYFLITCWWWLVAGGRGLHGRPKECRSHLRHFEIPTLSILHFLFWCKSRVPAGLFEWRHAFSCHTLQMHSNKCWFICIYQHYHTCYVSCLFDFPWFSLVQRYLARIAYH